jgi:hypothetical protein
MKILRLAGRIDRMMEKLLFEYRAEEKDGERRITIRHGEGAEGSCAMGACCLGRREADGSSGRRKGQLHPQTAPDQRVRKTLDFLEGLYGDLYGGEETS